MEVSYLCGRDAVPEFNKAALVVAHPGHELKVFGWMCEYAPRVYILTDGSGGKVSRLASSEALLNVARATPGEIFGQLADADMYRAVAEQKIPTFLRLLNWLSSSLVENGIDFVAGDATEGFNPTHDLCRALVNAAVFMAQRSTGKTIANYEFCLTEWEQHCQEVHDEHCLHLRLEDSLLRKKLRAAGGYCELKTEVEQAIAAKGEEYFRVECLKQVVELFPSLSSDTKPYYETFGEKRVAEGKYESVIRYQEHMLPILWAIREHALTNRRGLDGPRSFSVAAGHL